MKLAPIKNRFHRERAIEKQLSREADEHALASGRKSRHELRRENSAIDSSRVEVEFRCAKRDW